MPGRSDALTGKVSQRALEELEGFTRHNGWNEDDLEHWRNFIVYTFLDHRTAYRDDLREHLKETRREDSEDRREQLLDEYEEALRLLKAYVALSRDEG